MGRFSHKLGNSQYITLISKFTYKMLQWSCKPGFCNIAALHEAPP